MWTDLSTVLSRTDRRTDGRTEFSSLDRVCIPCSAVKKEKTPRCDMSHICPDHSRCATATKVVMFDGVLDRVNHARFHQNQFRILAPEGSKYAVFLWGLPHGISCQV